MLQGVRKHENNLPSTRPMISPAHWKELSSVYGFELLTGGGGGGGGEWF